MKPKVIGVVGFLGSGKDTAASFFIEKYGYKKDSFAAPLKDSASSIFGWKRELLEGDTEESRNWREEVDEYWSEKLNMPDLTRRYALQFMGTEVFRNHFNENIWVSSLEKRIIDSDQNIIVSDCRFPNEIDMIKNQNGLIVRVKRGDNPHWFEIAKRTMRGDVNSLQMMKQLGIHASEYSWCYHTPDIIIENDGSLKDLEKKVDNIIEGF